MKQIMAFYIVSPIYHFSHVGLSGLFTGPAFGAVFEVMHFLNIDRSAFQPTFCHLHSVIDIPPPESVYERPIKFFHKSFPDFLQDPTRSGSFSLDMDQARYDIAALSLRWYNHFLQSYCEIRREFFLYLGTTYS
jgi:hypothetical protein